MFFIISKILSFIISPFSWIIILLILSLLFRNPKKKKRLLASALIIFFIFSNSVIINEFISLWEKPITKEAKLKHYNAGIVLGGGMVTIDYVNGNRLIFQVNTDRIFQAIYLYKKGYIDNIILSSGSGSLVFKYMLESSLIKKYLVNIGIPDSVILVDSASNNTYENAKFTAQILKTKYPDGKFLLITSAIHIRRAAACFKKQNIEFDIYPTNKITSSVRRWDIGYLIVPKAENLFKWEKLIHETIGYLAYKAMEYL